MELKNKKTLVVGLGVTGVATSLFLKERGAQVTVSEQRDREEVLPIIQQLSTQGIELEIGTHRRETFANADLIVVSPGVPLDIAPLQAAHERGVEIISEIELAYRYIQKPIIAVTGTNGKTTTVNLIAEIFKTAGKKIFLGGNVGNPLIEYVLHRHDADYIIAEISSFQLEGIHTFKPFISVLLNLHHDHLDRYASYSDYIAAKARLFTNQSTGDYAVLNADDPEIQKMSSALNTTTLYFSSERRVPCGIYYKNHHVYFTNGTAQTCLSFDHLYLQGNHNLHNIMAAVVVSKLCGCPQEKIRHAVCHFKGLPHRLEFLQEVNKVKFYNDSKATNVSSVARALEALAPPVILIAGGKDKGGDYRPLAPLIKQKVKTLILLGEATEKMSRTFQTATPIIVAKTLEEAFRRSLEEASPGDTILLSPARSSFDMFANYKERGNVFKTLVANHAHTLHKGMNDGTTQNI
jgi:UDP-N-acetylmuramoylalanine--D-glutamate ligase